METGFYAVIGIYQHITVFIDNPLFRLIIAGSIFCGFDFIGFYSAAVISTLCLIDDFSSRTSLNFTSNGNCHLFARCNAPNALIFYGVSPYLYLISSFVCLGSHTFQHFRNCIRKCHVICISTAAVFYNNGIDQGISCHIGRLVHCLRNPQLCFRRKLHFIGRLAVYLCYVGNFSVHAVFDCTNYRDLYCLSCRNVNFAREISHCSTIYLISHIFQILQQVRIRNSNIFRILCTGIGDRNGISSSLPGNVCVVLLSQVLTIIDNRTALHRRFDHSLILFHLDGLFRLFAVVSGNGIGQRHGFVLVHGTLDFLGDALSGRHGNACPGNVPGRCQSVRQGIRDIDITIHIAGVGHGNDKLDLIAF